MQTDGKADTAVESSTSIYADEKKQPSQRRWLRTLALLILANSIEKVVAITCVSRCDLSTLKLPCLI